MSSKSQLQHQSISRVPQDTARPAEGKRIGLTYRSVRLSTRLGPEELRGGPKRGWNSVVLIHALPSTRFALELFWWCGTAGIDRAEVCTCSRVEGEETRLEGEGEVPVCIQNLGSLQTDRGKVRFLDLWFRKKKIRAVSLSPHHVSPAPPYYDCTTRQPCLKLHLSRPRR